MFILKTLRAVLVCSASMHTVTKKLPLLRCTLGIHPFQPNRIECILFFTFTLIEWAHYLLHFPNAHPVFCHPQLMIFHLSSRQVILKICVG